MDVCVFVPVCLYQCSILCVINDVSICFTPHHRAMPNLLSSWKLCLSPVPGGSGIQAGPHTNHTPLPLPHFVYPQPMEVYIDDETKLTLHGLQQHYVKLQDREKNRKLFDLLDVLEFNQVRGI